VRAICPQCHAEIPLADVNVSADIALCRNCSRTFSFADLVEDESTAAIDLSRPPKGIWFERQGDRYELGASLRSRVALFLVPFTLFWGGGSMTGIYGSQIFKGKFDPKMSLFGIPFLIGTVVLVSLCALTVFGKLVIRGFGNEATLFVGVGFVGWTRRFRWNEIQSVRESMSRWQQNGRNLPLIELNGARPIRFGSQLTDERRAFMIAALRKLKGSR
jgi:hypothetical protein